MIWTWWGIMALIGLVVGCAGAWSLQASRVFMKTLAVPLVLLVSRLAFPQIAPIKNTPLYVLVDFIILAVTAFAADYVLGLALGRHDRQGYRSDSVGH